jgi:preprotein translocase subunit SecD
MTRRGKGLLTLLLLVCLAVGCGSSHAACPHGAEIVLRAVPQHGQAINRTQMQTAQQIMVSRLNKLGVASPNVALRGSDEIVTELAGVHNLATAAAILGSTGQLQFFDFEKDLAAPTVINGNPTPYPTLYSLLSTVKRAAADGPTEAYYLFSASASHRVLQGPSPTRSALLTPYRGKQPAGTTILAVPANREVVSGTRGNFTASTRPVKQSPDGTYWYLFKLPPEISSTDLNEANIQAGADPSTSVPQVTLGFNGQGGKAFQAITKAEYDRGRLVAALHGSAGQLIQAYAQHNAIVLDGKLQAAPYIDYTDPSLSLGIAGAQAVISNIGSMQAARRLALVLQSGSLPYRFEQVSSHAGCQVVRRLRSVAAFTPWQPALHGGSA